MTKLTEALAKAQGQMKNAKLNKVNPHFKSKYADLAEIIDTVLKPLSDAGIAFIHRTDIQGDLLICICELWKGEDVIASHYPVGPTNLPPQKMGSALTYAKRYTLSSITGVSADDDDDGKAAATAPPKQQKPSPKPQMTPAQQAKVWTENFAAGIAVHNSVEDITKTMADNKSTLAKLDANHNELYQTALKAVNERKTQLENTK